MVFAAFVIVLLIFIILAWIGRTVYDLFLFIINAILGVEILMWFILVTVSSTTSGGMWLQLPMSWLCWCGLMLRSPL